MKDETTMLTIAMIAVMLSIIAIGIGLIYNPTEETDLSDIGSSLYNIQSVNSNQQITLNNLKSDIGKLNIRLNDVEDIDDIEELEDDIEELEDDLSDLEDDIDDIEYGDVEDCYRHTNNLIDFRDCLYPTP